MPEQRIVFVKDFLAPGAATGFRSIPLDFPGRIRRVAVRVGAANPAGPSTFDVNLDGASIFAAPGDRPSIPTGQTSVTLSGLSYPHTDSVTLSVDADAVPAGGLVGVSVLIVTDDLLGDAPVPIDLFVSKAYLAALGHEPSGEEFEAALASLKTACYGFGFINTARALLASLFEHEDFTAPTDEEYVTKLYLAYEGRDPADDPDGFDNWVSMLGGGETRVNVRNAFAESIEFNRRAALFCHSQAPAADAISIYGEPLPAKAASGFLKRNSANNGWELFQLLTSGKITPSLLPELAINRKVSVANQTAMLALTSADVQPGDVAFRADNSEVYLLTADDPSVLANWLLWQHPAAPTTLPPSGSAGGDLAGSYPNPMLADDGVTNAKLADMATSRVKGRATAGTGDPEDLTPTQVAAMLPAVVGDTGSGGTKGLVPAPAAGDAAKFLKGDGSWGTPAGGGGTTVDVQVFTTNGTWTKPSGCTVVFVVCIGAGGGGGGGYGNASTASNRNGGGGGGGGARSEMTFRASSLGSTETVTVGAGGAGGAGGSSGTGVDGGNGGASTFGNSLCFAGGGGGGQKATPSPGPPGAGGGSMSSAALGVAGSPQVGTNNVSGGAGGTAVSGASGTSEWGGSQGGYPVSNAQGRAGGQSRFGGAGGGSGGGANSSNAQSVGGAGGVSGLTASGGTAGAVSGGAGGNGADATVGTSGQGGGGGGANNAGTGGAGGNGGAGGGGGGGGGGGTSTGGAGGPGGRGEVRVYSW